MVPNLSELLDQFQGLQTKMAETQEKLRQQSVEGSSGGGMVIVQSNGLQEIVAVRIDKEVFRSADVEMLQDLVQAAVNESLKKAKEKFQTEMSQVASGLPLSSLFS